MPLTRAQGETALKYVVGTLMNQPLDGSLMLSLTDSSIDDVSFLVNLLDTDISNLAFTPADGTRTNLGPGHKGFVRAFCAYIRHRATQPTPIGDNWSSITREEFDLFRTSPLLFDGTIFGSTSISNRGLPAYAAPLARAHDPVADFKRSIKHDASQIPILKEQKQLDNWQRTTIAQTEDVAEKVDPTSAPITVEEKVLFRESQTFVAEVLDPTCTPISAFVKSKSTNVDSFNDERSALIRGSNQTVDTIDDCIMHRNVGLYDAHVRQVKMKDPDYATTTTFDTVRIVDDCIMHRNVGIYDAHDRQVKMKYPDHAMTPTVETISIARRVKLEDTDYATTTTDDCIMHRNVGIYDARARGVKTKEPDYETLRPLFGWLPVDTIKRTFAATAQFASIPMSTSFKATDTAYSDTRDIDFVEALLFVGMAEHVGHFLTFKILRVAPLGGETFTPLDSNDGETTKEYHHVSSYNNLDRGITSEPLAIIAAGDPVTCAIYAKDNDLLAPDGWKCFKLRFRFWEPVYHKLDDSTFPSESRETLGRFVGIAEQVGHLMTFKILTDDTSKVVFRSNVRSALDPKAHGSDDYDTFKDYGHSGRPPDEYKKIRVHLIFAVKHNGRRRLVADGAEIDTSELLDKKGIPQHQSLIGAMKWTVSIGRIDNTTAVMTLSGFRSAPPREGHLDLTKRVYGHLTKMKHDVTRVRTEEPDYYGHTEQEFDWAYSVYGNVPEVELTDAPEALGKYVTLTHYVDAKLFHDIITVRSFTGILHLVNKKPIDWYFKKRAQFRSYRSGYALVIFKALYGLRTSGLRWHERHMALYFHRVRESIAVKSIAFYHVDGVRNPADILSKYWGYQQQVWKLLRPTQLDDYDTFKDYTHSGRPPNEYKNVKITD
jgi:hypothetical protein